MQLIPDAERTAMLENGRREAAGEPFEAWPLVKLFTPDGAATWLLSSLDPDDPDLAFGLCDLGFGSPELGWVRLTEILALRGGLGLPVERDRHFRADRSLRAFAEVARATGRIEA